MHFRLLESLMRGLGVYLWLWCKVLVFLLTCAFVLVLLFVLMLTGHCMKNGLLYFCAYDVKYFCSGDFLYFFFVILSLSRLC